MIQQEIYSLSLITSCGCNLKCDYCYINKSVNTSSSNLQRSTIQALQDGTFLKNVQKGLQRIGSSPNKIGILSFWGQEPTLTLKYFNEHAQDWFSYLYNVNNIFLSTNGMINTNDIYELIVLADKYCTKECLEIEIQFSYDGIYSTNNFRHANNEIIYKNISNFIDKLNSTKFKKSTKIKLAVHGVLSFKLIEMLNTREKIQNFYKEIDNFVYSLSNKSLNQQVEFLDIAGFCIEGPYDCSFEDGLLISDFLLKVAKMDTSTFYNKGNRAPGSIGPINNCMRLLSLNGFQSPIDLVKCITENEFNDRNMFIQKLKQLSDILYCANGYHELKIMYDGTLINCQNSIYETKTSLINPEINVMNEVKRNLASHNYFINILTSSDKELNQYFDLFKTENESSFYFMFHQVMNLLYYLAKSNQINPNIVKNEQLYLETCYRLTCAQCCAYNNLITTGSAFVLPSGLARKYCNGVMDYISTII